MYIVSDSAGCLGKEHEQREVFYLYCISFIVYKNMNILCRFSKKKYSYHWVKWYFNYEKKNMNILFCEYCHATW